MLCKFHFQLNEVINTTRIAPIIFKYSTMGFNNCTFSVEAVKNMYISVLLSQLYSRVGQFFRIWNYIVG